jgi:ABC-2 type transport system ATP-binding protein
MDAIQIKNLSKSYDNKHSFAVSDLSFNISRGEIFGLLGPNGAGKTTLISMMCGLLKPTSGEVLIDNLNYHKNKNRIFKKIGVVPQEYALYPTLTAAENLTFFGGLYNLKGKDLAEKINSGLENVGLIDYKNKIIKTFSGGMKRRINLLTGILHKPEIIFLDEPTVGVDIQSKEVILNILNDMNQNGTTIIYTSHHMLEAENFCTKICIIDKGKILNIGTPQELVNSVEEAQNLEEVFLSLTGNQVRNDA